MDERVLHESRQGEAVVRGLRPPLRAAVSPRCTRDRVGPGAPTHGATALPFADAAGTPLGMGRQDAADNPRRLFPPGRLSRTRLAPAGVVAPRPAVQLDPHREVAGASLPCIRLPQARSFGSA